MSRDLNHALKERLSEGAELLGVPSLTESGPGPWRRFRREYVDYKKRVGDKGLSMCDLVSDEVMDMLSLENDLDEAGPLKPEERTDEAMMKFFDAMHQPQDPFIALKIFENISMKGGAKPDLQDVYAYVQEWLSKLKLVPAGSRPGTKLLKGVFCSGLKPAILRERVEATRHDDEYKDSINGLLRCAIHQAKKVRDARALAGIDTNGAGGAYGMKSGGATVTISGGGAAAGSVMNARGGAAAMMSVRDGVASTGGGAAAAAAAEDHEEGASVTASIGQRVAQKNQLKTAGIGKDGKFRCHHCDEVGHAKKDCPRRSETASSATQRSQSLVGGPRLHLIDGKEFDFESSAWPEFEKPSVHVTLFGDTTLNGPGVETEAMIDTGSDLTTMDPGVSAKLMDQGAVKKICATKDRYVSLAADGAKLKLRPYTVQVMMTWDGKDGSPCAQSMECHVGNTGHELIVSYGMAKKTGLLRDLAEAWP